MQDWCHSQLTERYWHGCHCGQRSVRLQPFLTSQSPHQPLVPLAWPGRTSMPYFFQYLFFHVCVSQKCHSNNFWTNLSLQNGLISKLISSTQTCNYQFDNKRKHMTEAQCTEKHLFIPFSHEYVISWMMTECLLLKCSWSVNVFFFPIGGSMVSPQK